MLSNTQNANAKRWFFLDESNKRLLKVLYNVFRRLERAMKSNTISHIRGVPTRLSGLRFCAIFGVFDDFREIRGAVEVDDVQPRGERGDNTCSDRDKNIEI